MSGNKKDDKVKKVNEDEVVDNEEKKSMEEKNEKTSMEATTSKKSNGSEDTKVKEDSGNLRIKKDLDDVNGQQSNLEPLENADDALKMMSGKINVTASIVKADEIKKANEERLKLALNSSRHLQPLNGWGIKSKVEGHDTYKISDVIPSLIKLRVSKVEGVETSLHDPDAAGYSKYSFIKKSMTSFSGNLKLVDYVVDSEGTFEKISFDDSSIPVGTMHLENFEISPENQDGIESYKKRTNMLSGLLELIFKVRKSANVFIRPENFVTFGSMVASAAEVGILLNSRIPDGGQPSIYIGVYGHELPWFREDVSGMFSYEDFVYGETSESNMLACYPLKIYSYYGTTTDSLFATLHHIFMNQFEQYRIHPRDFTRYVQMFSPLGGSIHINVDSEVDLYHVMGLSPTMIDQYRFMFLLSPQFRNHVTSCLVNMAINMKGLTIVPAPDVADVFESSAVNINNTTILQNQIATEIRPLSLEHFYEAMGFEVFHALKSPPNPRRSGFASYQDAAVALISIGLDALIAPNTFWTNVGIFSKAIYDAIKVLDNTSYVRLMRKGYTKSNKYVVDLGKDALLQGEIPFLFTNPDQTSLVREYLRALDPCGKLITIPNARSEIASNITPDNMFYLPWDFKRRDNFSSISESPLSYAVDILIAAVSDFINAHQKKKKMANAEVGAILTLISQMTNERGRILGSVLHCEGNLIMRQLVSMPWLMYSTYRGESKPNTAPFIGLYQTKKPLAQGLICNDVDANFPHGIGLWALLNLQSPQISKLGNVSGDGSFPLIIPDPIILYHSYENDVKHSVLYGEGYGFMSMLLNSHDNDEIEYAFLFEILGGNLRAGTVIQVLNWLLPNGVEPIISYNNGTKSVVKRPDMRLRDPGISKLDSYGYPINNDIEESDHFNRPLKLIDEFEKKKFKVAATVLADQLSPLHKISRGLTLASQTFENLSPDNRHRPCRYEIEYDDNSFPIVMVGQKSKICFNFNGELYLDPNDVNYPHDVRVEIKVCGVVKKEIWDYLRENVMRRNWQIFFPEILYLGKVDYIGSYKARLLGEMFDTYWNLLIESKYGELIEVTFYDTTSDVLNAALQIAPSSYSQLVCCVDVIRRNVVLRNAYSLRRPEGYVSPSKEMWTIGKEEPTAIPTDSNGRQKFKLPFINFNNYLKIFTKNIVIGEFPVMKFIPPLIQEVLQLVFY